MGREMVPDRWTPYKWRCRKMFEKMRHTRSLLRSLERRSSTSTSSITIHNRLNSIYIY